VLAEFYRGDEETPVAVARWDGRAPILESAGDDVRPALARVFRPTPVVVDDPSTRPMGSRGESALPAGNLEWFRAAALTRAPAEGFRVRMVPEMRGRGGWDPASAYRTFRQTVGRLLEGEQADPATAGEARRAERPDSRH
jgi:hypothetical protein